MPGKTRRRGLVLKAPSFESHKVVLLDGEMGSLSCHVQNLVDRNKLCRGALVEYYFTLAGRSCCISSIDVLLVPSPSTVSELSFLHCILDACLQLVPEGCCHSGVLKIAEKIIFCIPRCRVIKKIVLCRLLAELGAYPYNYAGDREEFLKFLLYSPIDSLNCRAIDLANDEARVDAWLQSCIGGQPGFGMSKAVRYLNIE